MNSNKFHRRAWCIFVWGIVSLAVLPLLLYLMIEGDISEQALAGWSSSLVIVPIITVSCGYCGFWIRQVTLVCTNKMKESCLNHIVLPF